MFDQILQQLAVVAVFVQRVLALAKPLYQNSQYQKYIDMGLSLAISAGLCVAWNLDVFAIVDIDLKVWGEVLTGLFAGLGSNVLNDLLKLLEMWKKRQQPQG